MVDNAGFFAVKNNAAGICFLDWWKRILLTKCINDNENGIFYDQTWLDLVPIYFKESTHLLTDLGYNMAYWNLSERTLSKEYGIYLVNKYTPLVFYHFARFKYYNNVYIDGLMIPMELYPEIKLLFIHYKNLLKANFFEKYITNPNFIRISLLTRLRISLKYRLSLFIKRI